LAPLGWILLENGKAADAEPLLRRSHVIRQRHLPAGDWRTASTAGLLGASLSQLRRFAEAEPLLLHCHEVLKKTPGMPELRRLQSLRQIVKMYDDWGRKTVADQWRGELPGGR